MNDTASITVTQLQDYQFVIDFGGALPTLLADESPPLGGGAGPQPVHMLLAATANCLSASLLFALRKFKQNPGKITATAVAEIGRNAGNRLRVLGIDVTITLSRPGGELEHLDRALGQFEDFCTVSRSVQDGIPMKIGVVDSTGTRLK